MAVGLCSVLRSFFLLQERLHISVHIDHIPGISNDVADSLSRGADPVSLGFSPSEHVDVGWNVLSKTSLLSLHPSAAACNGFLAVIESGCTCRCLKVFSGSSPGGSSTWLDQVWSPKGSVLPNCFRPWQCFT